jgi:hypothetical protein
MGTYSWEEDVCKAKTLLVPYRKIQYVAIETPPWTYRDLTYIVRITVIKTLALPLLVQIFTILSNPSAQVLTEIIPS